MAIPLRYKDLEFPRHEFYDKAVKEVFKQAKDIYGRAFDTVIFEKDVNCPVKYRGFVFVKVGEEK